MSTHSTNSEPKYVKFNTLFILSILFLYASSIYSTVIFLKISQAFSDSQPTNSILLFVLELTSLIGLFTIEIYIIDRNNNKVKDVGTIICSLMIVLAVEWVPRGFAYAEAYQFILDEQNKNYSNYNYLKLNLFASTALHSVCVLFNFIMTSCGVYYLKKEDVIINEKNDIDLA